MGVFIEIALVVIVGIYFFTQILLPPWIGKQYFWIHRKAERRVRKKEEELSSLESEEEFIRINKAVEKKKNQLNDEMVQK